MEKTPALKEIYEEFRSSYFRKKVQRPERVAIDLQPSESDEPDVQVEEEDADDLRIFMPDESDLQVGKEAVDTLQSSMPDEPVLPMKKDAVDALQHLVGLREVKKAIMRNSYYMKLMNVREKYGLRVPKRILHTVMAGNPGTGKTTVARILGDIYRDMGILSKGHLVEVNREMLVDNVIGGTERRTKEYIECAKGGVLFIDEAYNLTPADKSDRDFGRQVIDTLMPVLSEPGDMMVIFAGYSEEMAKLFETNPGLASRFPVWYEFEDYTLDELMEIAKFYFSHHGFIPTEEALVKMKRVFREAMSYRNFGNGRFVKTFIENTVLVNMAERVSGMLDTQLPDSRVLSEIQVEDISELSEIGFGLCHKVKTTRLQVKGFQMSQLENIR